MSLSLLLFGGIMKQIKQKFIDAIKAIDFEKLSIEDLHTLACAAEKIKGIDTDSDKYLKTLTETLQGSKEAPSKETLKDLR